MYVVVINKLRALIVRKRIALKAPVSLRIMLLKR